MVSAVNMVQHVLEVHDLHQSPTTEKDLFLEELKDENEKLGRNGRPLLSFVELIHEALENSETGMLSLQEIYESVKTKYPYFRTKDTVRLLLFFIKY